MVRWLDLQKLGPAAWRQVKLAGGLAAGRGIKAYLVGGAVRDMILGVSNLDLDIVVEGDGVAFARAWADKVGAEVLVHQRFGTAAVAMAGGWKFDVVTARRESYQHPGALPEVYPGTLAEDLYRRDITINAMAVSILSADCGVLYDELDGWTDLRKGIVRIIHERSFIDDPTRILRAVRYEKRFGFRMSRETLTALKEAVGEDRFSTIAPVRYWNEFRRILEEDNPAPALGRLNNLGAWRFLKYGAAEVGLVEQAARMVAKYRNVLGRQEVYPWRIYCATLLRKCAIGEAIRILTYFGVGREDKRKIVEVLQFAAVPGMLNTNPVRKEYKTASLEALVGGVIMSPQDAFSETLLREMLAGG